MYRKKLFTLWFCVCWQSILAGNIYDATSIPKHLKTKADAVIRLHQVDFDIHDIDAASHRVKYVITVLNKAGQQYASFYLGYDKQRKVKDISGKVYDAQGNQIKKLKNKDFEDFSSFSGSLFQDNRLKHFEHVTNTYPYTLEYEYEITHDGLLHYPDWHPQSAYAIAVEQSEFTVTLPVRLDFRYKEQNLPETANYKVLGDTKRYHWQITHLRAVEKEPFSPAFSEITPAVITAPNDFKYEGFAGNMESWNSFASWINTLNTGRDQLSPTTVQQVNAMVENISEPREKIRKLYEYLQSKTRYVSIQLGIGGYQPFDAATVDQVGYGDCKALSNYMKSLLKAVNIPAYYTLVYAGRDNQPMHRDFPSQQFNHAILCVPLEKDTVWLECTSQENPFGYLGDFTGDRDVLLIKPGGAEIVHTPVYSQAQNTQIRKAKVVLDEKGNGTAHIKTVYAGLQFENVDRIVRKRHEEQKKAIYQKTEIPAFNLNNFAYSVNKNTIPSATEKLDITLSNYANVSGKRLFFCPNLMNRSTFSPPKTDQRENDIVIKTPYIDIDTVEYQLPEALYPEYMPEPVKIESEFGEYASSFQVEQGALLYVRTIKINKGQFPATQYEELVEFYKNINKADHVKIVLKKST